MGVKGVSSGKQGKTSGEITLRVSLRSECKRELGEGHASAFHVLREARVAGMDRVRRREARLGDGQRLDQV